IVMKGRNSMRTSVSWLGAVNRVESFTPGPLWDHPLSGIPRTTEPPDPRLSWQQTVAKAKGWSHPANPFPCVPRDALEKIRRRETIVRHHSPLQQNLRTRLARC